MLSKQLVNLTKGKSVIRELHTYGQERAREIGYENVFDFSLGNPNVPAPPSVNDAIRQVLDEEDPVAVHGYGPGIGHYEARKAVADSLNRRFGMEYSEDQIFMVMSAAGALQHAVRAVTNYGEGDEVITFAPFFPEYRPYIEGAGAKLVVCKPDIETFQIDIDALEKMIHSRTKAVLINSPNNPSGIVYSEQTIKDLAALLERKSRELGHTIYIISDEPYREIAFKGVEVPYIGRYYVNTLVCYSFSKSLSIPGERLGYIAFHKEADGADLLMDCFAAASRMIGHNGPATLMQKAMVKVIDETAKLDIYEDNKNILYDALTKMGYHIVEPGGTFYMFPRSLETDANAFCEKAKQLDLLIVPGDSFGCPSHFRISYCVPTEKVIRSLPLFEKLANMYGLN